MINQRSKAPDSPREISGRSATQGQLALFREEHIRDADQQLVIERQRYSNLFNLAPVGFLALDEDNRIVNANVASALLFVVSRQNMIGEKITRFICPSDRDLFLARRREARIEKKERFEIEFCTSLGRSFYARLEAVLSKDSQYLISVADISDFKDAEKKLRDARDELQVMYDRLRIEMLERERAEQQLHRFSRKLLETQEEERRKIAQELHDNVGQLMTYLGLLLDKARPQLDTVIYSDAKAVAQEVLVQIRDLSSNLHPSMLKSIGLVASLQALFDRFKTFAGVQVDFSCDPVCKDLTGEVALAAYRIIQEALTNVARYAQVDAAAVCITGDTDRIRLSVMDHGAGFDPDSQSECTGITGMKERAEALHGTLYVCSALGEGTTVYAELPLTGKKAGLRHAGGN